jgi:hypothetical protein
MFNDELWDQEKKLAKQHAHEKKMGLKSAAKTTKSIHTKTANAILKNIEKREKEESKKKK